MSAPEALKTALQHNKLASAAELVAMGERRALRQPMVGPKVWAEAVRQACTCAQGIPPEDQRQALELLARCLDGFSGFVHGRKLARPARDALRADLTEFLQQHGEKETE